MSLTLILDEPRALVAFHVVAPNPGAARVHSRSFVGQRRFPKGVVARRREGMESSKRPVAMGVGVARLVADLEKKDS